MIEPALARRRARTWVPGAAVLGLPTGRGLETRPVAHEALRPYAATLAHIVAAACSFRSQDSWLRLGDLVSDAVWALHGIAGLGDQPRPEGLRWQPLWATAADLERFYVRIDRGGTRDSGTRGVMAARRLAVALEPALVLCYDISPDSVPDPLALPAEREDPSRLVRLGHLRIQGLAQVPQVADGSIYARVAAWMPLCAARQHQFQLRISIEGQIREAFLLLMSYAQRLLRAPELESAPGVADTIAEVPRVCAGLWFTPHVDSCAALWPLHWIASEVRASRMQRVFGAYAACRLLDVELDRWSTYLFETDRHPRLAQHQPAVL